MVKSSDGKLVIPRVNKIASQRKRAKSEKTHTENQMKFRVTKEKCVVEKNLHFYGGAVGS